MSKEKNILDSTCGGKGIWHPENKNRDDVLYIDKRKEEEGFTGQEGRTYSIEPDQIADFRDLPFEDETFELVIFDPPHIVQENGMEQLTGHITKSYGALNAETWQSDLERGFKELFRVLKPKGILVFKFANNNIDFKEVLKLAPTDPLIGTMTKQNSNCENRWFLFMKEEPKTDIEDESRQMSEVRE